jgi:hypothetical protein
MLTKDDLLLIEQCSILLQLRESDGSLLFVESERAFLKNVILSVLYKLVEINKKETLNTEVV